MTDLEGARRAVETALGELEPVVAGQRPATADLLARSIHALLRAQLAQLAATALAAPPAARAGQAGGAAAASASAAPRRPAAEAEAPRPIPPEALADDEDEPTIFLEGAEPLAHEDDDDFGGDEAGGADGADGAGHASEGASRQALARFEVEAINRWLTSGTPFQLRGDMAYLNVESTSRLGFDFRSKLKEMGFSRELGLIRDANISSAVLLFQRG